MSQGCSLQKVWAVAAAPGQAGEKGIAACLSTVRELDWFEKHRGVYRYGSAIEKRFSFLRLLGRKVTIVALHPPIDRWKTVCYLRRYV